MGGSNSSSRPRSSNKSQPVPSAPLSTGNTTTAAMTQVTNGTNGTNGVQHAQPVQVQQQSHLPLLGRVYAITGGCSGIGFATAQILSKRGATVCLADVDAQAMKEATAHFSALDVPYSVDRVDISKRKEVDAWIESIVSKQGRLDGAANVAGVIGKDHGIAAVSELDDDEWDKIIGVNLTGTMYCLRAELRNIADGGSIVNVSSIHGLKGKQYAALP